MEGSQVKQVLSNRNAFLSANSPTKARPNRHVSVLYGVQYLTRVPVVKRCRKTQYDCFVDIDKKQIFTLVHRFVQNILKSPVYLDEVFNEMKFVDNQIDATIVQSKQVPITVNAPVVKQTFSNKIKQSQQNFGEKLNSDKSSDFQLKVNNKAKSSKKISIMLDEGFQELQNYSKAGSVLFSDQSLPCLSLIDIPQQQLNLQMVQKIYEQPQPFLINLSVCLMLKFLYFSQTKLSSHNVCWILGIGTIIAYKIYYDEPVQGLVESFSQILKIKREHIIDLQRHFLAQIDYEAVISNQQYHSALYQMIKQGVADD